MAYEYDLHESINLHVKGRITSEDARRQKTTARVILQRLAVRPGIILADEVGMGKTFVALAVAVTVAICDKSRRPVVVMVPPSLKEKWPKDFRVFRERCIQSKNVKHRLTANSADNAIEFLKLLDDAPHSRVSIIFLTHGAMSPYRKLQDKWVKLAILQKALYRRREARAIRRNLCRFIGELLRIKSLARKDSDVWEELLETDPRTWLDLLVAHGLTPADHDDPVPTTVLDAMEQMDFYDLYISLKQNIPQRTSGYIEERLKIAREDINEHIVELWDRCIRSLKIKLPLLVLDEAHHLKNPRTQLASLFHVKDAHEDADELSSGPLGEVFERMLFLTATPFQLGHHELCSVLERFTGISWKGARAPSMGLNSFQKDVKTIRKKLDAAQEAAIRLDQLWGRLHAEDLSVGGRLLSPESWWVEAKKSATLSGLGEQICRWHQTAKKRMKDAEEGLRPYVIRHARKKTFQNESAEIPRRLRFSGRTIVDEEQIDVAPGLVIQGEALLPFLLAARVTALRPESRPVFAEGLASSYEAFLHTRQQRMERMAEKAVSSVTDKDDDKIEAGETDLVGNWYLNQLEKNIAESAKVSEVHPKVASTVEKALALWKSGEKVLIFCHYLATGSILQEKVKAALNREIYQVAAKKLRCSQTAAKDELDRVGERFFKQDSPIWRGTNRAVGSILSEFQALSPYTERIQRIARRYLRTPSYLVRYFPLKTDRPTEEAVFEAIKQQDASGMTFENLLKDFFKFLEEHCSEDERERYIDAVESIQTGSKVRLANGQIRDEMRQRLMLTFNTPFYPEILIASMVMAEGVDLHLNCRHVIHHDLCWNPSTLEQRTGRIDRIGAKVERCCKPIHVYMPYISQTQDEKMYRVVMDRERWFKVVMGEKYKMDARTTEKMAERVPFPEEAAKELIFDLSVFAS